MATKLQRERNAIAAILDRPHADPDDDAALAARRAQRAEELLAEALTAVGVCLNCHHSYELHDYRKADRGAMWCCGDDWRKHPDTGKPIGCQCPGWGGNGPLRHRIAVFLGKEAA